MGIEQAGELSNESLSEGRMHEDPTPAVERMARFVAGDEEKKRRLMTEMAALAIVDGDFNEAEGRHLQTLCTALELTRSEFVALRLRGFEMGRALLHIRGELAKM